MEDGDSFSTITTADMYVWCGVIVIAFTAGAFRVLRNGQWRGPRHAVGVVGCASIVSLFVAAACHATTDFARRNPMLVIALSGAVALLGKEAHERLILGGVRSLAKFGESRNADDGIEKQD